MEQMINKELLQQDEMIDRYLMNQMTASEEAEFESLLRTDVELRCRARFVAQTIKAMKEAEDEGLMTSPTASSRLVARKPLARNKKK